MHEYDIVLDELIDYLREECGEPEPNVTAFKLGSFILIVFIVNGVPFTYDSKELLYEGFEKLDERDRWSNP